MGYELFITRAESVQNTRQAPISEDEWELVVAADPDLEWSMEIDYVRTEKPKRVRLANGSIVTRPPANPSPEQIRAVIWKSRRGSVALWRMDGAITTKNPDKQTVQKLVELATHLGARVLGEEGEEYCADGTTKPPDAPKNA